MSASIVAISAAIFDLTQWDARTRVRAHRLDKLVAHPWDGCEKLALFFFYTVNRLTP